MSSNAGYSFTQPGAPLTGVESMLDIDSRSTLTLYLKELEKNPESLEALHNAGNLYLTLQQWEEAQKIFERIREHYPEDAEAYNGLGIVYLHKEKLDDAKEALLKAIELKSDYADAYTNLGIMYFDSDDVVNGEKVLRTALEINPESKTARNNLEVLLELKVQHKLAARGLLKEIRRPIKDLTPYQNRVTIEVKGKPLSETIIEERR